MQHDAIRFIDSIRTRSYLAMLHSVEGALINLARARTTRYGDAEMTRFLLGVRAYLLSEGRLRPRQLDDDELPLLKPLCEQLVQAGRFPFKRLELFAAPGGLPPGPPDRASGAAPPKA